VKEWCVTAHPGVENLTLHHFLSFSIAHSLIKRHLGLGNGGIGNNASGVAARADIFVDGRQLRRNVLLKQPLTDIWLQFAQAVQPPTVEFNAMGEGEECDCLTFTAEHEEEEIDEGPGDEGEGDDDEGEEGDEQQGANAEVDGAAPKPDEDEGEKMQGIKATKSTAPNETEKHQALTQQEADPMDLEQSTTGSKRDGGGDTPSSKRSKADIADAMDVADEGTSTEAVTDETDQVDEAEL